MEIGAVHSHLNGLEWLIVHRSSLWDEIREVLISVDAEAHRTKKSKEKTMLGKMLFSPTDLNETLKGSFSARGWLESRTGYWVTDDVGLIRETMDLDPGEQKSRIEAAGRVPIYSYNQTDFQKDRVAVEIQFGKYSFIAYDLFVKHLAFFISDRIDVGVEVLPMKRMQAEMSSGPGYYEGALYDIARHGRANPPVPLVVIGVLP